MDGDLINQLPSDKNEVSPEEQQIIDTLFTNPEKQAWHRIYLELQETLIIGIVFVLLHLPFLDDIIQSISPQIASTSSFMLGIKSVLFMVLVYFIRNLPFIKKK